MKMKAFVLGFASAAAAVGVVALTPAHADVGVIPGTGYSAFASGVAGVGNTGLDAFGNSWTWSKTSGPTSASSPGKGFSAWGTPGLGKGEGTYESDTPAADFEVVFLKPFGKPLSINETPSNFVGGYNEWTRFEAGGVAWDPVFSADAQQVDFYAPTGVTLVKGESFFVNVVFNQKNLSGANSGFSAVYSAVVPETSTWAMLALGFAGVSLAGMTKRRKGPRYAL